MGYISGSVTQDGSTVNMWVRQKNRRILKQYPAKYEFYSVAPQGQYKSLFGEPLRRHKYKPDERSKFSRERDRYKQQGIKLYESDISPVIKCISDYFYEKPSDKLHLTLLDIEVDYRVKTFPDDHKVRVRVRKKRK